MKTNSPEVVQYAISGSMWPTVVRGERAADARERGGDHVVDVHRAAHRGAQVLDAQLVVPDRRREPAERRAQVAVHGERRAQRDDRRDARTRRSAPTPGLGGCRTASTAAMLKPSVLPSAWLFTSRPYRIIEKARIACAKKMPR